MEDPDEKQVKTLQLRRALSGGFGFSLMGGKGTSFPPVICDILSDSPASKCETMQVGDIILEINGEPVHGKTTKEVVTSLMRSPDDLILKVKEDSETRERVIKFLEPLENPPGGNQKNKGSIKLSSPQKRIETKDNDVQKIAKTPEKTPRSPEKSGKSPEKISKSPEKTVKTPEKTMPEKSAMENGTGSKQLNHAGTSQSEEAVSAPPVVTATPLVTEMLNSNNKNTSNKNVHLLIPEKGNTSVNNQSVHEHPGVTSPTSKRVADGVTKSFSSDSSLGDTPTGQVLTTVAQVHREDSTLLAASGSVSNTESHLVSSDGALGERVSATEQLSDATEESTLTSPARQTDTILENDSTGSELSQLSETSNPIEQVKVLSSPTKTHEHMSYSGEQSHPHPEWHHNKVTSPNPVKDIHVNRTDSGYASASSVTKFTNLNHVQSQSTQTSEETVAETSHENQVPYADESDLMDGNGLSCQPDVLEGVEGATQSPRPSVASSTGSDESDLFDMDSLENALMSNSKNLDVPSAKRLAKRLYNLDGFKRSDVAKHLSKRNDFSKLVAEEYLGYFTFHGLRLDQALRKFLSSVAVSGESQERERVLNHFSRRFHQSNPDLFNSEDAVQILTCAVMLLNTDLHGQNIGRKMTVNGFINNLEGTNDGDNFPKETLKALYQSIKSKPLEWATDGEDEQKEERPSQKPGNGTMSLNSNPFVEVQNDPNAPVYIKGYIMRKCVLEPDGKKTSRGKRGWKMYYATLKGLILYLHKSSITQWNELRQQSEISHQMHFNTPKEALSLHHSLAAKVPDYSKRPHVFSLKLANWKEYLIQCLDTQDLQNWMQAFNLASAVHSSPPLPAPVGSQKGFKRPLLPSSSSKLTLPDQLTSHESKVDGLEHELEDHRNYPPEKGARVTTLKDYRAKQDYLEYEVSRFKTYVYLLHSQPTMPIGKFSLDEVMPQSSGAKATIGMTPSTAPVEPEGPGQAKLMFEPSPYDSDDSNSDISLDSSSASDRNSVNSDSIPGSPQNSIGSPSFPSDMGNKGSADITQPEVMIRQPSYRVEERVTDEDKPNHTYWELLDDDEKTNLEILDISTEEEKGGEAEKRGNMGENNNNGEVGSRTTNQWNELHLNEVDEETFL